MDFVLTVENFSLKKTLFSGQCFRFKFYDNGEFDVFAGSNYSKIEQEKNLLKFKNSTCGVDFWISYFDLNINYSKFFEGFYGDVVLESAMSFCNGLHILKQDPFEVLISFLFSANNNIPRIKKIVSVFCENFGTKFEWGFSFPKIDQLSGCVGSDLSVLKAGFRTEFVLDAITRIKNGEINLKKIGLMDIVAAKNELLKIKGVGEKIASCVLLFGYHRFEVFPVDVWMKRVLNLHYRSGLSKQFLSCPGLAQQILYHSARQGEI